MVNAYAKQQAYMWYRVQCGTLTISPLLPIEALMASLWVTTKTMCGGNKSDGQANTSSESTDYDGLYMELGGEGYSRNAI
jgi:hypothetical protein